MHLFANDMVKCSIFNTINILIIVKGEKVLTKIKYPQVIYGTLRILFCQFRVCLYEEKRVYVQRSIKFHISYIVIMEEDFP